MQDATRNDAGPPSVPDVLTIIDGARAHGRPHPGRRYRRLVVRMADDEVARLDAVRTRFPKVSRAALLRASTIVLLALPGLEPPVAHLSGMTVLGRAGLAVLPSAPTPPKGGVEGPEGGGS